MLKVGDKFKPNLNLLNKKDYLDYLTGEIEESNLENYLANRVYTVKEIKENCTNTFLELSGLFLYVALEEDVSLLENEIIPYGKQLELEF